MANFNLWKYNFFFKDLSLLNELTQHTPLLSCCRFYLEKFDQWQICVSCLLTFEKNIAALKTSKYYYFTRLMKCINKEQLKNVTLSKEYLHQQHVSLLCFTNNLQVQLLIEMVHIIIIFFWTKIITGGLKSVATSLFKNRFGSVQTATHHFHSDL